MSEFLNTYSGWIAIISLFVSIPLGVLGNLATPHVKKWLDYRSIKGLQNRIESLEELIDQADRVVSEPSFAIAKFINIEHRAMMQKFLQYQIILIAIFLTIIFREMPLEAQQIITLDVLKSPLTIIIGLGLGSLIAELFSSKTFELYSLTHHVEKYEEWRADTLNEIKNLQNRLEKMRMSEKPEKP